jgi:hypothetical protein
VRDGSLREEYSGARGAEGGAEAGDGGDGSAGAVGPLATVTGTVVGIPA